MPRFNEIEFSPRVKGKGKRSRTSVATSTHSSDTDLDFNEDKSETKKNEILSKSLSKLSGKDSRRGSAHSEAGSGASGDSSGSRNGVPVSKRRRKKKTASKKHNNSAVVDDNGGGESASVKTSRAPTSTAGTTVPSSSSSPSALNNMYDKDSSDGKKPSSDEKASNAKKKDDDDSDVEIEGMELEEDSPFQSGNDDDNYKENPSPTETDEKEDSVESDDEELRDYEETQKERKELATATSSEQMEDFTPDPKKRLEYLLGQSEVFAHFLAGSVAMDKKKKGNKKKTGRGGGKRLTEAEEDSALLKTAQSHRKFIRLEKQPSILSPICKMHDYQLEGLNWMLKLHDHGINGILADEMGLGKTLQTISLLAYLREARGVKGPHIVVVPKSVVGNWIKEFNKWCPTIRAIKMLGTKDERIRIRETYLRSANTRRKFDVFVTSYEGILKEKGILSTINWNYLIIDEAHRIKNENSSLSKVVRTMKTRFRILITGTPLQNNLHELWALLNFLMPDIFGDAEQFDSWFSMTGEAGQENVIRKLHTVLKPFMLRRVKKDVACGLPPKKETKLFIGLSDLQHDWYTRVLRKDAHELNGLGGPDKVRLLNILMQLRKVCNHPYLFDGAEPGPPYFDGPHLWETSGKMMLLNKLLPKLKERGSRILIFSQMTRVLDILEDYLRYQKYQYCRIDGNTSGDNRESQVEEFNTPGSPTFVFLLSTRAGGLGINLATADIVILFDSDWNPQVDLQAMDRAHRIGQTKPVQVFRLVTEGTVEEKIIERADRKLFLDAAVIQQGRLAEQHSGLDKGDLMKMVRFGADQILKGGGRGTYTDEDIDALIAKGEKMTNEGKARLQTDAQHNLANFSLLGNDEDKSLFDFEGTNYREDKTKSGNFINLPQRERKRNYDVNEYYREAMNTGQKAAPSDPTIKKRKKLSKTFHDFQFHDKRIDDIEEKDRNLAIKKENHIQIIHQMRMKANHSPSSRSSRGPIALGQSQEELLNQACAMEQRLYEFELPKADVAVIEQLKKEAFAEWTKKDFKAFCSSLERHGRFDLNSTVDDMQIETDKEEAEIKRYFVAFWVNYRGIAGWEKIIERIERGEKKIARLRQIKDALREKVERHLWKLRGFLPPNKMIPSTIPGKPPSLSQPEQELLKNAWQSMTFNYGIGAKGRAFTEEEDAFLVCMMHKHGYGAAAKIQMEIRRAWQFRFDWFFKSRNAQEIQKRCDSIIKVVEKENEEAKRKGMEVGGGVVAPPKNNFAMNMVPAVPPRT